MRLLWWSLAGVVTADVLLVIVLAITSHPRTGMGVRSVPDVERLRVAGRHPPARPASVGRRVAALAAAATLVSIAIVASPSARHAVVAAPGAIAQALSITGPAQRGGPTGPPAKTGPIRSRPPMEQTRPTHTSDTHRAAPAGSGVDPSAVASSSASPVDQPATVLGEPSSTTTIQVAWSDVDGEAGYRVERSLDGSANWAAVATTDAGVTTYTDDGLEPGTTYYYRVFAITPEGDSPPSDTVSATTAIPLAAPGGVTVAATSSTKIEVEWVDVVGETGFRVERSLDGVTDWSAIATTGQDVTTYLDKGLTPGSIYFYRIVAIGPFGDSAPSDVASATSSAHPLGSEADPSSSVSP